jgi:hypothetical protein
VEVKLGSCDGITGGSKNVSQSNYTCNAGYFKVAAPLFCQGEAHTFGPLTKPWLARLPDQ